MGYLDFYFMVMKSIFFCDICNMDFDINIDFILKIFYLYFGFFPLGNKNIFKKTLYLSQ